MNRIIIPLLVLLIGNFGFLFGQGFTEKEQRKVDSLLAVIRQPKHDTSLASAYVDLSTMLAYTNWDTVFVLCNKAVAVAEKGLKTHKNGPESRAFKQTLSKAFVNLGYVNSYWGKNDLALEYNWRSLKIKEQLADKRGISTLYLNIGAVYYDIGDIASALEYFSKSARMCEEVDDVEGMAYAYNNMGAVHLEQGDDALAFTYFEKTRQICEKIDDRAGLAMAHNNIAQIKMKDPADTTALVHYTKAMKLRESMGDREGIAQSYSNIGHVYEKKGDLVTAKSHLIQALSIQEEIEDQQGIVMSCVSLAGIALKLGPTGHADALNFGTRALALAKELGSPREMADVANILSEVYRAKGQFREALEMYELHVTMRDSILNEENRSEVMHQRFQYDYDKKEALLAAEQEKKDAIAEEQLHRREVYLAAAAGITLLLGIMSLMAFFAYRAKAKVNVVLENKNRLIENQKKEITDSILYAENIQRALLPQTDVLKAIFPDSFILFCPKDVVSGDFYWMTEKDGITYVAVGDCTGHGVPGAMLSVIGLNSLNRCVSDLNLSRPKDVLMQMTLDMLVTFEGSTSQVRDGMDIALCAIDLKAGKLSYAGANNPLWIARDGEMLILKASRRAVGYHDGPLQFGQEEMDIQKGDVIYLSSDGFQDQMGGPNGKKYMTRNFREHLLAISGQPANQQYDGLLKEFTEWRGANEQTDDVCVVGVRLA